MTLLNKIFKNKKHDKTDYLEVVKTKIFQKYSELAKKVRDEKRQEIEDTKKALEDKNEEYKNIVENKDKKYQEMNKLEREFHQKINKHKNEVTKIQKEIKDIDKNILLEIDKYEHLTKNDKKFINLTFIYKIKNQIVAR